MGQRSQIEWTQSTWNPVTGCSKVSPGCEHCYAERLSKRLCAMGNPRYRNGFSVTLHHDTLNLPLTWRRPSMIFVNSMSDLFHELVPTEFIQAVFQTMMNASWHTFQIVTKRTSRFDELASILPELSNVWIGVSIERQDYTWRARELQKIPAKIRFISYEPLLGPLHLDLQGIDWVIVGGESGPGARHMNENWVRPIRDQSHLAGIPFFFKQWGGRRTKKGGDEALLDGKLYREMPSRENPLFVDRKP